jgi:7-carboxy-7-deazaguanine synthase
MLRISEIFHSIQGESTYAGRPCVMIRLSGCNLDCAWCDTRYAMDGGRAMSLDGVLRELDRTPCPLVEITGGEPLIQPQTPKLISALLKTGRHVLVETNGSVDIDRADRRCVRIMDVKCPGSGMADRNDPGNYSRLTERDQVKFVLADRTDYEFARETIQRRLEGMDGGRLLLSPVEGRLAPRELAEWILADRLDARMQLQLHRHIWPDIERGV